MKRRKKTRRKISRKKFGGNYVAKKRKTPKKIGKFVIAGTTNTGHRVIIGEGKGKKKLDYFLRNSDAYHDIKTSFVL